MIHESIPVNAAGGACFINPVNRGPWIDTGVDANERDMLNGRIFLSAQTIAHYARELGWIDPGTANEMSTQLDDADAELDSLRSYHARTSEVLGMLAEIAEATE